MPLLERERELSKLMQSARYGKPALVCGPPGIGKTQLLLQLRRSLIAEGMPVLYFPFVQPLHAFLASVAARLSLTGRSDSSVALRGMLWTSLEANPKIILLDGIAEPSLPFYRFFERLLYVPGMALIGSGSQPYATGALHRIFWNPQTILSLRPLWPGRRSGRSRPIWPIRRFRNKSFKWPEATPDESSRCADGQPIPPIATETASGSPP